jgi:hypothetical protein
MAATVLHVSDPDQDGYTRVIFLDPVEGEVRAKLSSPLENKTEVYDPVKNQMVPGDPIHEVTNLLNGQRECLLAGNVSEIFVNGESVWGRAKTKDQKTPGGEPGTA